MTQSDLNSHENSFLISIYLFTKYFYSKRWPYFLISYGIQWNLCIVRSLKMEHTQNNRRIHFIWVYASLWSPEVLCFISKNAKLCQMSMFCYSSICLLFSNVSNQNVMLSVFPSSLLILFVPFSRGHKKFNPSKNLNIFLYHFGYDEYNCWTISKQHQQQ